MRTFALGLLALASCGEPLCADRVTQRAVSPDGLREAVVFERDCGATTAYATHVEIGEPAIEPQGSGDLFVASRGNIYDDWNNAEARVDWTGPASLTITYDPMSELSVREDAFDGVAITYRQRGR